MAGPMDALASFIHLAENIPEWLSKLDDLAAQVADQHARFARVSHSHFTQYRLSKKHDSTESLRPSREDLDDPAPAPIPISAPPREIPPTSQPSTTPLAREIQRKRKPASNLSVSSGPQKYRTRTMVIVYYNSAIQAAFEDLVRCIAAARNNLRKGKTAASLKARMLSIGMGNDDDDDAYPILNPKMMIKRVPRSPSPPDVGPRCDQADGDLEAAQNLCEVAAHQFLRDGDCEDELEGTRKRFEDCLKIAKEAVEKLKAEKEGDGPADASESTVDAATPTPIRTESVPIATQKLDVPRIPVVPTLTANGTIEVDDEFDTSSVHIDLTAFRRTRRV
ncbi:MAG: hypothetical protein LQ339_006396 [Xanthoria mediterranea]|nr:MAG: hypothetical protein LQ339_006396 [Xanthoria mediterranea]